MNICGQHCVIDYRNNTIRSYCIVKPKVVNDTDEKKEKSDGDNRHAIRPSIKRYFRV